MKQEDESVDVVAVVMMKEALDLNFFLLLLLQGHVVWMTFLLMHRVVVVGVDVVVLVGMLEKIGAISLEAILRLKVSLFFAVLVRLVVVVVVVQ